MDNQVKPQRLYTSYGSRPSAIGTSTRRAPLHDSEPAPQLGSYDYVLQVDYAKRDDDDVLHFVSEYEGDAGHEFVHEAEMMEYSCAGGETYRQDYHPDQFTTNPQDHDLFVPSNANAFGNMGSSVMPRPDTQPQPQTASASTTSTITVLVNKRLMETNATFWNIGDSQGSRIIMRQIDPTPTMLADIMVPKASLAFIAAWPTPTSESIELTPSDIDRLIHKITQTRAKFSQLVVLVPIIYGDAQLIHLVFMIQNILCERGEHVTVVPVHTNSQVKDMVTQMVDSVMNKEAATQYMNELMRTCAQRQAITAGVRWLPMMASMSCTGDLLPVHECYVLQDSFENLHHLSQCSLRELMESPIDKTTAKKVYQFFNSDPVVL